MINYRFHLSRSSASSIISLYLLMFLKSSRSCVLFLPTHFTSVICPSMAPWIRQFLRSKCPIHFAFLSRILYVQELIHWFLPRTILYSPFSSSSIFGSFPNNSAQFSYCPGLWAIQCNTPNLTSNKFLPEFTV